MTSSDGMDNTSSFEDLILTTDTHMYVSVFDYQNILYLLIGVIGVLDNTFVIAVILNSRSMRQKLTNKFIINQSVIDFSASLFLAMTSHVRYDTRGLSNQLYCKLWMSRVFVWGLGFASTYNLLNITIERYLETVYPLRHKSILTRSRVKVMIAFPWIVPMVIQCLYKIPTTNIINGQCKLLSTWPSELVAQIVNMLIVTLHFHLPFIVMVIAYIRIYLSLRTRISMAPDNFSVSERRREQNMVKARKNVLVTMVTVCFCFFICWSVNETFVTLYYFGVADDIFTWPFYSFTVYLVLFNSAINPVIYTAR